jgi:hypothetical protein
MAGYRTAGVYASVSVSSLKLSFNHPFDTFERNTFGKSEQGART